MKMEDNNFITKEDAKEYEKRTYEELSSEFQKLYPSVLRAAKLIPLMYNRLTLVENLSHKEANAKMYEDHKHLPGFSRRNICRHLPLDNRFVPRRIRASWRKNSITESRLSNTIQEQDKNANELSVTSNTLDVDGKDSTKADAQAVEYSGCIELSLKNHELEEAVEKSSQLTSADNMISSTAAHTSTDYAYNKADNKDVQSEILEFEFCLPKRQILDYWGEPYIFIKDGDLAIPFSGKINRKSGQVISARIGRIHEQQIDFDNGGDMQND
jgi:hypothetical protein